MNPELGQGWFRIAMFITVVSAALLLFEQPGTAEFVITVVTLAIGLLFIGLVVYMVWKANH